MRLRHETREKVHRLNAGEVEAARRAEARTITVSDFTLWTSTTDCQVRKEIDAGTLRTRMLGKRRRIVLTPDVRLRLQADVKTVLAVLGLDERDESSAKNQDADETAQHDKAGDPV
jgi:hypothetical protein